MDPLSALGIAAAVAQFVDLGSKLVRQTKEISDVGSAVTVDHLSRITDDLGSINSSLQQQSDSRRSMNDQEQALLDLSVQCNKIVKELLECLHQITLKSAENDTWASLRVAIQTIWSKQRFDNLTMQLRDFREQLTLRVLVLLNAHRKLDSKKLDSVLENKSEIIEAISISSNSLRSTISNHVIDENVRHRSEQKNAERRHAETIAAILTTRDGHSQTITGPKFLEAISKSPTKVPDPQTVTTYRARSDKLDEAEDEQPDFETKHAAGITERILDALHYRRISERLINVSPAHQRTFQWVFQEPASQKGKWDSLVNWLRHGSGCYWVSGKAGSGKSTFLKFVQQDARTSAALREWAGPARLVIGSFYFWYAGTSLQKSQIGLLRSLLLDVLSQHPTLALVLFPDLYRSMLARIPSQYIDLSITELTRAFQTLVTSVPQGIKICFFVDGIDEYEGDQVELCDLFSQATKTDSVKFLLSSRPIPSCVHAFRDSPQLGLQHLTHGDIQRYIQDKLGRHTLLERMELSQPGSTVQIIEPITSKASGVFLWVTLVVRLVIIGLQEYDTISSLIKRIDDLPEDLEKLYDLMLGSMNPRHRAEGSRMLQLVLRSMLTHGEYPMTLLQLSFAEEGDCEVIPLSQYHAQSPKVAWRLESTQGRMRSRCCGLIEVLERGSPDSTDGQKAVGFLHRTVAEFLQIGTIWDQVVSHTKGSNFHVDRTLMSSSLWEMKAALPTKDETENSIIPPAAFSMLRMLTYEQNMVDGKILMQKYYLAEMMATMEKYWGAFGQSKPPLATPSSGTRATSHRTETDSFESFSPEFSFLLSAAILPPEYFKRILDLLLPMEAELMTERRDAFSAYLLASYLDEVEASRRIAMSRNVVTSCTQPNRLLSLPGMDKNFWARRWRHALPRWGSYTWSTWEFSLHYAHHLTRSNDTDFSRFIQLGLPECFCEMLCGLVRKGADVNSRILALSEDRSRSYSYAYAATHELSAFAVLRPFMLKIWNKRTSDTFLRRDGALDANKTLAEELCHLEDLLVGRKAILETSIWKRGQRTGKAHKQAASDVESARKGKSAKFSQLVAKGRTEHSKKAVGAKDSSDGQETKTESIHPDESPWRNYEPPASKNRTKSVRPKANDGDCSFDRLQKWNITPRARRIELLDPEEKDLASQLARADLSARDQREIIHKMSKYPSQAQSQIFECSTFLRLANTAE